MTTDLSRNESSWGPPPSVLLASAQACARSVHRYPIELNKSVQEDVDRAFSLPGEAALLTRGVDEAVDLVLRYFQDRHIVMLEPEFTGFHERINVAQRANSRVSFEPRFQLPLGKFAGLGSGDLLIISSPHNPTGIDFPPGPLREVADRGCAILLDRAYRDFADNPRRHEAPHPNMLRFYSFSKAYGLAGLRVGVLVGPASAIASIQEGQCFLPIDTFTLHVVQAAIRDPWMPSIALEVRTVRETLLSRLRAAGVAVENSQTNFVLIRDARSELLREFLASRGIAVASTEKFGLPSHLRVSVGTMGDVELLTRAFSDWGDQVHLT